MSEIQIGNLQSEAVIEQPDFLKRLLWVFTSPGKLAAVIAEKPKALLTLLISSLPLPALYLSRPSLYEDYIRNTIMSQGEMYEAYGIEMTPEMLEASVKSSVVTGYISAPLAPVIGIVLSTLIFFAIFKIVGGQGKFKAYLSVVSHAAMISALYTLLLIPISFATGSLHRTAPITSLAILASPGSTNSFLYGILASLDVFSIWQYVVMAIGFTAVSKLKKSHVYAIVAAIFVIGMIIAGASMNVAQLVG